MTKLSERAEEIVEVAGRLFLEKGYDNVSVNQIIQQVGIAKGTFYHYFQAKDDLLEVIASRMSDASMKSVLPVLQNETESAIQRLNDFGAAFNDWQAERMDELIGLVVALSRPENLRLITRLTEHSKQTVLPHLSAVIEAGVAEGTMKVSFPREAASIVLAIGALMDGYILELFLKIQQGGSPPAPSVLESQMEAFHDGVERVLGIETGKLVLFNYADLARWLSA